MQYLFVATHVDGGGPELCSLLSRHPNVSFRPQARVWSHPTDWHSIPADRYATVKVDFVTHNHQVAAQSLYRSCKFIYLLRETSQSDDYYCFRLRRLCEMAKVTGGVLLFGDDLAGAYAGVVQEYLGLRRPFSGGVVLPDGELSGYAKGRYEKYVAYLKRLNLNTP